MRTNAQKHAKKAGEKMKYYLAIDIGASSGRHILSYLQDGKMVTEEIYRFQNGPETLTAYDGKEHLMWTHERLFTEILNGLKKAGELGKIPASVGIDTWGVDYALLDESDQAIGGTYCYRDGRTEATIPAVHSVIPFAELYRIILQYLNQTVKGFHKTESEIQKIASSFTFAHCDQDTYADYFN